MQWSLLKINMANPNQNAILIEKAFEEILSICRQFQEDSGAKYRSKAIIKRCY